MNAPLPTAFRGLLQASPVPLMTSGPSTCEIDLASLASVEVLQSVRHLRNTGLQRSVGIAVDILHETSDVEQQPARSTMKVIHGVIGAFRSAADTGDTAERVRGVTVDLSGRFTRLREVVGAFLKRARTRTVV